VADALADRGYALVIHYRSSKSFRLGYQDQLRIDGRLLKGSQCLSALEAQRRREEYLAFVAHDLRTPLNAIALTARVLELAFARPGRSADTAQMRKTLHRNVQALQALIEKVLKESDHIRTDSGIKLERREFDLWPLVEALVHDLHPVDGTASTKLTNKVPQGAQRRRPVNATTRAHPLPATGSSARAIDGDGGRRSL
jgi:signal transduction histidine kinase